MATVNLYFYRKGAWLSIPLDFLHFFYITDLEENINTGCFSLLAASFQPEVHDPWIFKILGIHYEPMGAVNRKLFLSFDQKVLELTSVALDGLGPLHPVQQCWR